MKISDEARELAASLIRKWYSSHEVYTFVAGNTEIVIVGAEEVQTALDAERNKALEDAAAMLDSRVVNVNGTTNGKSGALIDDPFGGKNRDAVRGTYADAIRAMKVKP